MGSEFIRDVEVVDQPGIKDLTKPSQAQLRELPKYLEPEYIRESILAMPEGSARILVMTLWYTGIRVSEALGIRKQDLDVRNRAVRIRWLKSRHWAERYVPLHPEIAAILGVYTASKLSEDRLFPFTRQRAYQICRRYVKCHPHQLRHSFAVHFLRSGGSLVELHKIMGHRRITTTQVYLNIVPSDIVGTLNKIRF